MTTEFEEEMILPPLPSPTPLETEQFEESEIWEKLPPDVEEGCYWKGKGPSYEFDSATTILGQKTKDSEAVEEARILRYLRNRMELSVIRIKEFNLVEISERKGYETLRTVLDLHKGVSPEALRLMEVKDSVAQAHITISETVTKWCSKWSDTNFDRNFSDLRNFFAHQYMVPVTYHNEAGKYRDLLEHYTHAIKSIDNILPTVEAALADPSQWEPATTHHSFSDKWTGVMQEGEGEGDDVPGEMHEEEEEEEQEDEEEGEEEENEEDPTEAIPLEDWLSPSEFQWSWS